MLIWLNITPDLFIYVKSVVLVQGYRRLYVQIMNLLGLLKLIGMVIFKDLINYHVCQYQVFK